MARFPETRWSLVLRAGSADAAASRAALSELLGVYTPAVDTFLQGSGVAQQDVGDIRQAFFVDLLEHEAIRRVDPVGRVRFRWFLMGAIKNHLSHHWERESALKRGGGLSDVSLDQLRAKEDGGRSWEPADPSNPERDFKTQWVIALIANALDRLARETTTDGRSVDLEAYRPFLTSDEGPDHEHLATELGTTSAASRARLKRLRRRFHLLIREAAKATLDDARDLDDELRTLLA